MTLPDSIFAHKGCLACGLDAKDEIHDSSNVWFHHHFSRGDVEKFLVQKMADQIAKEVDNKILDDLFFAYRMPFNVTNKWSLHPLSYMTDLSDCQNESVELHPKERSILPEIFVDVHAENVEYNLWEPHDIALEDESRSSDFRQIRANERHREKMRLKKLPWFLRLLSR